MRNDTACFIDAGYLQNLLGNLGKPKINYQKLVKAMCGPNGLLRTYYYDCKAYMSAVPTEEEKERQMKQQSFHEYLQRLPQFECKFGRLEKRHDELGHVFFEQKRVDVMLAIDLVTLSTKRLIRHALLMTGDSDMLPAVQIAKNEGVVVELFHGGHSTHRELVQAVDVATVVDQKWIARIKA
ncbi:NYN domain-containing protein [Selenomonas sputigena]|uniref:NYN domain-containing protein n=1 Tax=Selenomonas sputigena TaxID=69823 RepID=A0ABV3X4H2_9FIRM